MRHYFYLLGIIGFIMLSCSKNSPMELENQTQSFMTGNDGKVYKTVKIGDQWWIAENLRETEYRSGDKIQEVTDNSAWRSLSSGARCVYENDENNSETHGYLYNWYAVNDSRKISPYGWHVPTDEEWKELEMNLGMSRSEADNTDMRGTNEGSKLAGRADLWWDGDLKTNAAFGESGFSALPAGFRTSGGYFTNIVSSAVFWSSTEISSNDAWNRSLGCLYTSVSRSSDNKRYGFSVRLVRDN